MEFLPNFLDLKQRHCFVVGGGDVALRKVRLLLRAGARVELVSLTLCDGLQAMAEQGDIIYCPGHFSPSMLEGKVLVVAATDDALVNRQVQIGRASGRERV